MIICDDNDGNWMHFTRNLKFFYIDDGDDNDIDIDSGMHYTLKSGRKRTSGICSKLMMTMILC